MSLSDKRIEELEQAERKLIALESGGVDNWDGYEFAMEEIQKEEEIDELIETVTTDILEELSATAYEPSERGCGLAFADDAEYTVRKIIRLALQTYDNID